MIANHALPWCTSRYQKAGQNAQQEWSNFYYITFDRPLNPFSIHLFLQDAYYIQECVPEELSLKRKVWTQIDQFVNSDQTIMARYGLFTIHPDLFHNPKLYFTNVSSDLRSIHLTVTCIG